MVLRKALPEDVKAPMTELVQNLRETDAECAYGVAAGETAGFSPSSTRPTRPSSPSARPRSPSKGGPRPRGPGIIPGPRGLGSMSLAAAQDGAAIDGCLALVRRRRLMGGVLLALFAAAMVSGFATVNDRSAGGLLDGLPMILDIPTGLPPEAWAQRADLPGHMVRALPALIETVNIAAVATLAGATAGPAAD